MNIIMTMKNFLFMLEAVLLVEHFIYAVLEDAMNIMLKLLMKIKLELKLLLLI